jgi:hypothetical protein
VRVDVINWPYYATSNQALLGVNTVMAASLAENWTLAAQRSTPATTGTFRVSNQPFRLGPSGESPVGPFERISKARPKGDSGRNNPFDWARPANQATVDCVAILAIRAAGAVGGYFVCLNSCPGTPIPPKESDSKLEQLFFRQTKRNSIGWPVKQYGVCRSLGVLFVCHRVCP